MASSAHARSLLGRPSLDAMSSFLGDASISTNDILRARVHKQLPVVKGFLDGTVTYVLSREWHDLLSVYIFQLHPLPHCSETVGYEILGWVVKSREDLDASPECTSDATAWEQARYAIILIAVFSVLEAVVKRTKLAERYPHVIEQYTAIAGMCVGWAVGDAVVKYFTDYMHVAPLVAAAPPPRRSPPPSPPPRRSPLPSPRPAAKVAVIASAARQLAEAAAPPDSTAAEAVLLACGYSLVAIIFIVVLQVRHCGPRVMMGSSDGALSSRRVPS